MLAWKVFKALRWYHHDVGFESPPLLMMAAVIGAFAASAFFSWQEFKYFAWGRSATATVIAADRKSSYIGYEWRDPDDGKRQDRADAGDDTEFEVGSSVDIEYLPGVMASRLPGMPGHHKFSLWVFGLSSFAIFVYVALLWRKGNRELKEAAERTSENGPRIGTPS